MILHVSDLRNNDKFDNLLDEDLEAKLKAIEMTIRKYSNNNFQNKMIRFEASSCRNVLNGNNPYLKVNDTIQISKSVNADLENDGLYVVTNISSKTTLNRKLFDSKYNLITKIEYPSDVKEGAFNLLLWEIDPKRKDKAGIKSETISRHKIEYGGVASGENGFINGYPIEMLSFLTPYIKMRY